MTKDITVDKKILLKQFTETRERTLKLVSTLEHDDYTVQTARFTSPPKWHIGHVSWIYEAILSKINKKYTFFSKEFSEYLNSYYQQFGTPNDKGERSIISRPTLEDILKYYNMITQTVNKFITTKNLDKTKIRLLTMGIHHECQHQELLVYDLQHLLAAKYKPVKKHTRPRHKPVKTKPIKIDGGLYTMGYNGSDYCYDIELPEHKVYLNEYNIDSHPVTNAQYMEFIKDGGYENYTFWLSDGWEKVKENGWRAPMYWKETKGGWITNSFLGNVINPNEPVCHVSYYEADAYCKWAGRRLPTEAEWEKAACWNEKKQEKTTFPWGNDPPTEKRCNLLESYVWGRADISSYPKGVSHYGCQEMIGNVWEWTSSEFAGYPGFESGFDEYNDKWFTGQKVLRGGSFGTPMISIRASYRNFFRLDERWMFSGFRCAGD